MQSALGLPHGSGAGIFARPPTSLALHSFTAPRAEAPANAAEASPSEGEPATAEATVSMLSPVAEEGVMAGGGTVLKVEAADEAAPTDVEAPLSGPPLVCAEIAQAVVACP